MCMWQGTINDKLPGEVRVVCARYIAYTTYTVKRRSRNVEIRAVSWIGMFIYSPSTL